MTDTRMGLGEWLARWQAWSTRPDVMVLLAGALAVVLSVVALGAMAVSDFRSTVSSNRDHAALLARVLEDQATRTVESAQLALEALSSSSALRDRDSDPARMEAALRQALSGLSFLRALAVVNRDGYVLASTQTGEAGMELQIERLGPRMAPGQSAMGPLVPGRFLDQLRRGPGAAPGNPPSGMAFIPLLQGYQDENGLHRVLVGLINPDTFSNFQHLTLESESYDSVITTYQGTVLASSSGTSGLLGRSVAQLPIYTQYLPSRQHSSYIGPGAGGDKQILAFRASSTKPLVVVVEEAYDAALWRWIRDARALLSVGLAMVFLVLGLTAAVWRGVRIREGARRAADAANARVAQSEQELSVLMRSVQELIFRTDAEGHVTFVNAHWEAFHPNVSEQVLGRRLDALVDPTSRVAVLKALVPRAELGVRKAQVLLRPSPGREYVFDMAVVPLVADGRLQGFAGSAVDVTARWVAQQKLQAQIAFQSLLLETNPLPIAVTDTHSLIVQVNRAWEDYKGWPRDRLLGQPLTAHMPADEAQMHHTSSTQLLRWGGSAHFEAKVLHGDGSRRDTRVMKAAITDALGQVSGVLCILMDVSEFREAERVTQEARDAAEEASRSKSEFVANMSHELRTPLQSILGFAELGVLRGKASPKLAEMFADIHAAGQRMLALVNDLLEVSKLESTVGTMHLERLDLRGPVRSVAHELEPLLARQHQQLRLELGEVPLVAKADPMRFQQVVRNVLANAIKFSPQGSTISLAGQIDSAGQVHFSVRDQGPGVPEAELEQIFEAFVQSSKTKDGSGGTGLGLAICRKIIEAMGGRIYAQNAQPEGAVFHIVLPARGFSETMPAGL
ncbi:hypothetical protein GCM10023090_14450 [Acidovorax lacteus]|uniref:histidine kinase n=2 Tax=Acidovorax lacteus TaxID=1924988 RepID=A0ABP8L6X4_9BURK